jgi:thiamine-phosphate diphosphorylase
MGREIVRLGRERGVPVVVNDRADLALAIDADGVHLGAGDLPPAEARRLLPRPKIVGVSTATPGEARAAEAAGADYLGAGPVFATATKPDAGPPIGLEGLAAIVAAVGIPVVGIGGIHAGNAAVVIEAGAAGVAVVSTLMTAEDPEAAARELRRRLEQGRRPGSPGPGTGEASG